MKILNNQTDELTLSHFGEEVVQSLFNGDFRKIADRFGYALAFGRDISDAIKSDYEFCTIKSENAEQAVKNAPSSILVKYFKPNNLNLFAVVQCVVQITNSPYVLVDLIVTIKGEDTCITLEDVSSQR